jgi:hypothetical protein
MSHALKSRLSMGNATSHDLWDFSNRQLTLVRDSYDAQIALATYFIDNHWT